MTAASSPPVWPWTCGHSVMQFPSGFRCPVVRFGRRAALRRRAPRDAAWQPVVPGFRHLGVEARIGIRAAGDDAPPALWPGAGTGRGRPDLLRAHPLLEEGVLRGAVFGRSLWSAGLELGYRPWRLGPVRIGVVGFVDVARPGGLPQGRPDVPTQVDAGGGIRLGGLGSNGELSLNAAHGLNDGESALSLVWRTGKP
jgi:hypothetical protein